MLSCAGCNKPKQQDAEQEVDASQQAQWLNDVIHSIELTRAETNYTTTTNVTSESLLATENHKVIKKVDIISQHKAVAGVPNIKQVTNEFIYSNDSLYIKNSWLSYKTENTLGVEKQDKKIKWESNIEGANINYANVADRMINVTKDNVSDITCTQEGASLVYIITFKPDVSYDINPIAVEYNTDNTITKAKLRVVVDSSSRMLSQTTFITEYVNDSVIKAKNGMLHNSSLFTEYPVTSAAIQERTNTVYSDYGNTSFAIPDLSKFQDGTPNDFYTSLNSSSAESQSLLENWVGEEAEGYKTNILWD